jgi:hypothetical protein
MDEESFEPGEHLGESVTLRGTARTAAAGAIVSVAGEPVYVDGLDRWSEEVEGKSIEVTGVLRLRESGLPAPPEGEAPMHGLVDDTFVLDDAEWVLSE